MSILIIKREFLEIRYSFHHPRPFKVFKKSVDISSGNAEQVFQLIYSQSPSPGICQYPKYVQMCWAYSSENLAFQLACLIISCQLHTCGHGLNISSYS